MEPDKVVVQSAADEDHEPEDLAKEKMEKLADKIPGKELGVWQSSVDMLHIWDGIRWICSMDFCDVLCLTRCM